MDSFFLLCIPPFCLRFRRPLTYKGKARSTIASAWSRLFPFTQVQTYMICKRSRFCFRSFRDRAAGFLSADRHAWLSSCPTPVSHALPVKASSTTLLFCSSPSLPIIWKHIRCLSCGTGVVRSTRQGLSRLLLCQSSPHARKELAEDKAFETSGQTAIRALKLHKYGARPEYATSDCVARVREPDTHSRGNRLGSSACDRRLCSWKSLATPLSRV